MTDSQFRQLLEVLKAIKRELKRIADNLEEEHEEDERDD